MKKAKWATLSVMLAGGALLFQSGCLSAFWDGFWKTGLPSNNRWFNLAIDVANELVMRAN